MLRFASLVALSLGLTGCGTMPFDYDDGGDTGKPVSGNLATSIPPSMAMAAVPVTAGQVVSVIERKRGNALQHEITLYGAPPNFGSNQVTVTAFKYVDSVPEKPGEDMLAMAKPTDEEIYKEMQERIPGGPMEVSGNVPRNAMGPFGYAFGRRNGANCIYAWQWIESGFRPFNMVANKTTAPVSVRVRICRPGMTEEVMVDFVRQMYVQPRSGSYPGTGPMVAAPMARPMAGDALAAARGSGYAPGYAPAYGSGVAMAPYAAAPYPQQPQFTGGYGYNPAYAQQQAAPQQVAPVRKVAAAPKKTIRRIVRRRVVAPQIYSYTPVQTAPQVVVQQPQVVMPAQPQVVVQPQPQVVVQPQAQPVIRQVLPGAYSAVPMPQ